MATLLRANGSRQPLDVPATGLSLAELQRLVGGSIEIVSLGGPPRRRDVLVVHDNGLAERLPVNALATYLYRGDPPRHDGVVVGDVVLAVLVDPGLDTEAIV